MSGEARGKPSAGAQRLRRKLLSLGLGELVAAAVFVLAGREVDAHLEGRVAAAWWSALLPLLIILPQAGCFWLLARSWAAEGAMPVAAARVWLTFGVLDVALLLWGALAVTLWSPDPWTLVAFLAVWAFGVLELVNYFVVRLAHPARRWLSGIRRRQRPWLTVGALRALE